MLFKSFPTSNKEIKKYIVNLEKDENVFEAIRAIHKEAKDDKNYVKIVLLILSSYVKDTTKQEEYQKEYKHKPSKEVQEILRLLCVSEKDRKPYENEIIDLSGSYLRGIEVMNGKLMNANLSGANIIGCNFYMSDLTGVFLSNALAANALFTSVNLTNASMSSVDLRGAVLDEAILINANLQESDLTRATLMKADLTNTFLDKANLTCSNLFKANMKNANVNNAVLKGVYTYFHKEAETGNFKKDLLSKLNRETSLKDIDGGFNPSKPPYIGKPIFGTVSEEEAKQIIDKYEERVGILIEDIKNTSGDEGVDKLIGELKNDEYAFEIIKALHKIAKDNKNKSALVLNAMCSYIVSSTNKKDYQKEHRHKPSKEIQEILKIICINEKDRKVYDSKLINLSGAYLRGVEIMSGKLTGANLNGINIMNSNFYTSDLAEVSMENALAAKALFVSVNFTRANMKGIDLRGGSLDEAMLINANLETSNLTRVTFMRSDLTNALLNGASLVCANLFKAEMTNANFDKAVLKGVYTYFHKEAETGDFKKDLLEKLNRETSLKEIAGGFNPEKPPYRGSPIFGLVSEEEANEIIEKYLNTINENE